MSEEKKKNLLDLMRYWLFGVFVIVFVSMVIYVGLFTFGDVLKAVTASAPIWGTTGVLCIIWFYAYRWYINRT